jgi:hypothetical protein
MKTRPFGDRALTVARIVFGALAGVVAGATVSAQAPESLANLVFYGSHRAPGFNSPTYERYYVLRDDGSFTVIYSGIIDPLSTARLQSPFNGTFTYTKTAPDQATLVTDGPDNLTDVTFSLEFDSPDRGIMWVPGPPVGGSFSVQALPFSNPLVNTSQRAWLAPDETAIIGFVAPPGKVSIVLIRAVGPGLAGFPGTTPAVDPRLQVFQDQTAIAENDDWETGDLIRPSDALRATTVAVGAFTGAFPLADGSKDAAIVLVLLPGNYTIHVRTAPGEATAEVLGEIYVAL